MPAAQPADIQTFVLAFLAEIGAGVQAADGVYTVAFPTGFKRKFGRERSLTFDPEKRREHVEVVEAGSPLLRMLLSEAELWGGLSVYPTDRFPPGTRVYTFRLDAYSSLKKRTHFVWAVLEPGAAEPSVRDGVPTFFHDKPASVPAPRNLPTLQEALPRVLPAVERAGRAFAQEAVLESHQGFAKAMGRVQEYLRGLKQDTFLEEARIRKRLGEIQSKLYFTEDGLREIKLQRESERLTHELHALKKRNVEAQESLTTERDRHTEQLRRRHEPKLRVRLIAATLVQAPPAPPRREAPPVGLPVGAEAPA